MISLMNRCWELERSLAKETFEPILDMCRRAANLRHLRIVERGSSPNSKEIIVEGWPDTPNDVHLTFIHRDTRETKREMWVTFQRDKTTYEDRVAFFEQHRDKVELCFHLYVGENPNVKDCIYVLCWREMTQDTAAEVIRWLLTGERAVLAGMREIGPPQNSFWRLLS